MRLRFFALLCVLWFVSIPVGEGRAQSTASVSGRVTDPRGDGVPGAIITLYARENGTRINETSDSSGAYRFDRVAPGEYILETQATGFSRAAARSFRVEPGRPVAMDVSLSVAAAGEVVVVTASGGAQTVDQVSKAISSLSQQEILERDEFDVSESLRTLPGLRIQQLGGPGSFVSIKTRGLRNEDTAILIDGARIRDASAPQGDATGYLEDLIITDVNRIEVLRGSGSSLYGSNAIGGVVNIVTDEGGGRTRGNVLLEGGALGLFRGRARLAGSTLRDRLSYSAGLVHLNVSNGVDGDDAARNSSGQGRMSLRLSPNSLLSARIYSTDSFLQLNTGPQGLGVLPASGIVRAVPLSIDELRRYESGSPAPGLNAGAANLIPSANNPDWSRAARIFSGLITFTQKANEAIGYTLSYHGLVTNRTLRDGPAGVSFQPSGMTRSDYDALVHTLTARLNWRPNRFQQLDGGYEFESENFVNRSFPVRASDNSLVDVTQRSHTVFLQDQVRLLEDRLQFSAAFRAQYFTLRNPVFEPTATAPYRGLRFGAPPTAFTGDGSVAYTFPETGTKIRAHAGNGYRSPSLYERFGTFYGSFGYSTYGDPRLRPDRSIAVDGGVDQAFLNNRVRASATYFYTRLQEIIIFDFSGGINPGTDPFGRFGGYLNSHGGLARGLELAATLVPTSSLDLSVAYTYTNSDQRRPVIGEIIRSLVIPNHQFSIVATQRLGRRWFVNADLTAVSSHLAPIFDSRTFTTRAFQFDGVAKLDFGASYRIPITDFRALRLYGKVDNVFRRKYYENGFRVPGAVAIGGLHFEF